MPSILVVDDHRSIREPLAAYLRRNQFDVATAADGVEMRARLKEGRFDLIVLDLMLPGEDGMSLCRFAVEEYGTPIIMLTARVDFADRIAGLETGADDYLIKPFSPDELIARIRTVLRRAHPHRAPQEAAVTGGSLHFDGWCYQPMRRRLFDPSGAEVPLSTVEQRLLQVFLTHPNEVLGRDALVEMTRRDGVTFDRSIDSQVSRLRKKLEADPRRPRMLKTVWGDGYVLAVDVVASEEQA